MTLEGGSKQQQRHRRTFSRTPSFPCPLLLPNNSPPAATTTPQIDENLMSELKDIKATVHPTDTLLVVDAMTGQEAASLVKSFNDQVSV